MIIYFLLVPSSPPRDPPPPLPGFPPTASNRMPGVPPRLPPRPIPHSPVSPGRGQPPPPSPTPATAGAMGGRSATGKYLSIIIPLTLMGSESIAHEAEGPMGYWLRAHEGKRNVFVKSN